MMKNMKWAILIILICLSFTGCGKKEAAINKQPVLEKPMANEDEEIEDLEEEEEVIIADNHPNGWIPGTIKEEIASGVIVIDAGHQGKGNSNLESIGPGSSKTKPKVASGTRGVSTKIPEYELTLTMAKKLRDALVAQGYEVVMVRETHDVNISNKERADIANQAGAAAFIRIHANGSNDSSVHGVLTACQTAKSPYCAEYYSASRKLSDCVVKHMSNITGAKNRGVWETDDMSGTNWCKVPSTIIEMGFMTNPQEDYLMSTEDYQTKMIEGMVKGINEFLEKN